MPSGFSYATELTGLRSKLILIIMKEIVRYHKCFVCGENNHHGLKAKFYWDGEKAFTELSAEEVFEGYPGIYHGGIISTLLDEVMIKAILADEIYAVTAEMTVKYKRPVKVGDRLKFTGRVESSKGRIYYTVGEVTDETGNLFATATGKYLEAKSDLKESLKLANEA